MLNFIDKYFSIVWPVVAVFATMASFGITGLMVAALWKFVSGGC